LPAELLAHPTNIAAADAPSAAPAWANTLQQRPADSQVPSSPGGNAEQFKQQFMQSLMNRLRPQPGLLSAASFGVPDSEQRGSAMAFRQPNAAQGESGMPTPMPGPSGLLPALQNGSARSGSFSADLPMSGTQGKVMPILGPFFRRQFPDRVRQFETRAQGMIQNLSNNAFSQEQLDQMSDQIYRNITLGQATALGSINPNQRPLTLSSSQYRIVQDQLNKLTPGLREPAIEHFNRAVQNGTVRCSDCGAPRR
jgi:hypothetical protein